MDREQIIFESRNLWGDGRPTQKPKLFDVLASLQHYAQSRLKRAMAIRAMNSIQLNPALFRQGCVAHGL